MGFRSIDIIPKHFLLPTDLHDRGFKLCQVVRLINLSLKSFHYVFFSLVLLSFPFRPLLDFAPVVTVTDILVGLCI